MNKKPAISEPSFRRRRRRLRRYRQIIRVLTVNGFGLLFEQIGLYGHVRMRRSTEEKRQSEESARLSLGERLRRSCEQLGPTFVKIGQILSTRPDILSPQVTSELEKLQDAVHPFSYEEVCQVVEEELGSAPDQVFLDFEPEPLASASLSQVHRAKLKSGEQVAVKVQRPGIREQIEVDLDILRDLVRFITRHTRYGELYDFIGMVEELDESLTRELDFRIEGENADRFRKNLEKVRKATVPHIYWVHSTSRVLTMEYIKGMRITDKAALLDAGIDCSDLGVRLAQILLRQVLEDGFYHADPHPGNLAILEDGTIVFLDLGMVGHLSRARQKALSRVFIGIATQDAHQVVEAVAEMGTMKQRVGLRRFEQEVDRLLDYYLSLSVSEIDVGDVLAQIFQLAYQYQVTIPGEMTLIAKMLITLQGVLDQLDPTLNLLVIMKPLARKLIWRSWNLEEAAHHLHRSSQEYSELLRRTPSFLLSLQRKLEDDDFNFQFNLKEMDKIKKQVDRTANRLSFSVILLAVSIIIAGIIIGASLSASASPALNLLNEVVLRASLGLSGVILIGLIISMIRSRKL